MTLKEAVALRLSEILDSRGLSQYDLSQLSGVAESTISTLKRGKTKSLNLSTLYDLCASLNIELEEFFADSKLKIKNIDD